MRHTLFGRALPLALLITLGLWWSLRTAPRPQELSCEEAPEVSLEHLGSESCKGCHEQIYKEWSLSHHRFNMTRPSPESIRGDFEKENIYEYQGSRSHMFQEGGRYFMEHRDRRGHEQRYEINFTIGIARHQAYLHQHKDGRLQILPTYWNVQDERWRDSTEGPVVEGDALNHTHPFFWNNYGRTYNRVCMECHSSQPRKRYDLKSDRYQSHFDPAINCESCHGPGSQHVQLWKELSSGAVQPSTLAPIQEYDTEQSIEICAGCHGGKVIFQEGYTPGDNFYDYYAPDLWRSGYFHVDGRNSTLNYHFVDYMQSTCFRRSPQKLDCGNSCHPPHSLVSTRGKTVEEANVICTRCHVEHKTKLKEHSFHSVESEGSRCVNCHMPKLDLDMDMFSTDHSIGSPLPELSRRFGIPNACNGCHEHDSAEWAEQHLQRWFGDKPHFQAYRARMLERAETLDQIFNQKRYPLSILIRWAEDSSLSLVERGSAAHFLGERPEAPKALAPLLRLVQDPHPLIRYYAVGSLARRSEPQAQEAVERALKDPRRILRVRAFDALRLIREELDRDPRYAQVAAEWRAREEQIRVDDPRMKSDLAMLYYSRGDLDRAEQTLKQGVQLMAQVPGMRMDYIHFLLHSSRLEEAEAQQRILEANDPGGLASRTALGIILLARAQPESALKIFEELIQAGHKDPVLFEGRRIAKQRARK